MFNLGLSEIVLISIIALIFIGPKQLPEIARAVGKALNELKKASEDLTSTITNPKNFSQTPDSKQEVENHTLQDQFLDHEPYVSQENHENHEESKTLSDNEENTNTSADENNKKADS